MTQGSSQRNSPGKPHVCSRASGIQACIFKQLTSVPELSFAVRHLKADGGVVITASHNPREYNGYKVYSPYGTGQLGPEESLEVMKNIQRRDPFTDVKRISYQEGLRQA